jgi:uncharacterized repeat protein (TIGR01451 family)
VLTVQPLSQTVLLNDTAVFAVVATSGTTLSYQWLKNGANISGATSSILTITNAQTSDQATYAVKVTNAGGTVTSSNATLTVLVPPGITTQPVNQTVAQGQSPALSVVATGTAPLTYQWYFNGTALSGATSSTLTISNAQVTNSGAYSVAVSNLAGGLVSSSAVLTVVNPVIVVDNTSSAVTNATTLSWPHTVGSGNARILIVGVAIHNSSRTITSATYGSQNLTFIGQSVDGGGKIEVNLYQLLAPPAGTANVTVTINSGEHMAAGAVSFTGVSQLSPLGTFASAGGSGLSGTVSLSSATNEVVIDVMGAQGAASILAAGGNQMLRWANTTGTGDSDALGAGSTQIGSPQTTMSWTLGASKAWALCAVALKPVPPAATLADVSTTLTGPTSVIAGANFACTVAVSNAGPAVATNIIVSQTLPGRVAFFSASGGGVSNNGVALWPAFNLPSGASTNFTLILTAPAVGTVTSVASSTSDTYDPNTSNNDGSTSGATVQTVVTPLGNPGLGNSANTTATNVSTMYWLHTVPSGDNRLLLVGFSFGDNSKTVTSVTYGGTNLSFVGRSAVNRGLELWSLVNPPVGTATIVATWSGNKDTVLWSASFTNVDQTLPFGTFQSTNGQSTTPSLTVASSPGNLVVDIVATTGDALSLTANASQTTISTGSTGTSSGNARGGGSFKAGDNSVTMSWTLGASKGWDLGAVTLNAATPVQADVVTTVSGPAAVTATSNLTYTITVTNAGPATANSLVVSDILPAGTTFANTSSGGTNANGIVYWVIPSLTNGATTNLTITVTAPASGSLTNTVSSTAATSDPYPANNTGRLVTTTTNTPPVANSQTVSTPDGMPKNITLTGADAENSPLSFAVVTGPSHGVLSGFSPNAGTLTYSPTPGYTGPDSFTFVVNDGLANSASATVSLTVTPLLPTITTPPLSQAVTVGQNISLSVVASGTAPFNYQWWFNGTPLAGATNSVLSLNNVQAVYAGSYSVVVANIAGSVSSPAANLTVTNPPTSLSVSNSMGLTSGGFSFVLSVPAGATYVILASSDMQNWAPIATNVAATSSVVFTDPAATNNIVRFYRAMVP